MKAPFIIKKMKNKYKPILLKQTGNITLFDDILIGIIFGVIFVGGMIWAIFY